MRSMMRSVAEHKLGIQLQRCVGIAQGKDLNKSRLEPCITIYTQYRHCKLLGSTEKVVPDCEQTLLNFIEWELDAGLKVLLL